MQIYNYLLGFPHRPQCAFIYRRAQREFWTCDSQHIRNLCREPLEQGKWNGILLRFMTLLITFIVNVLASLHEASTRDKIRVPAAIIATRLHHIRIIQYMICMEMIRVNLKVIGARAIRAGILQGAIKQCLAEIRSIHHVTLRMNDYMNDEFGYSQLQVVVFCYFIPLTDLNWTYMSFYYRDVSNKIST